MPDFDLRSSTIEKGIDLVKDFLERAFGPSVDEYGLMRQDNMKFRRAKNQLKIFKKAKNLVESEKIEVKQINFKALFPLLEGISLEEDEKLQEMWAQLFVNYIDINKNLTINVYPGILKEISSNEATILQYMEDNAGVIGTSDSPYYRSQNVRFTDSEIANLKRLGLIEEIPNVSYYDAGMGDDGKINIKSEFLRAEEYIITDFGQDLLRACKK